ncbi:MAG: VacB/RNase II family 3'-5' exoribonuclease [Hahellaceae bacterium]|nr:VacB/RNase II family 3'-5' exoribonuclease [Hahellaceae bacterium]
MLKLDALNQLKQLKQDIQASRRIATGVVKGTPSRFGFVTLAEDGRDIYLSAEEMQKVFPGDEIEVELHTDDKGKDYAEVLKLIKTHLKTFVGRYVIKGNAHFAEPDVTGLSRWLFLPPDKRRQAKEGDYIACRIAQHPIKSGKPQAEVLQVLGNQDTLGIERCYVIKKHDLESDWDHATQAQVSECADSLVNEQTPLRKDARNALFVTIDSASTTDMDDALHLEETDHGWQLQVAIADPTALIAPGTALEHTAMRRATSVYFPGEPLAMLPEAISSHLCSLVAGEDRLVLMCSVAIDRQGNMGPYKLFEAVIRSRAKLSYTEVARYLESPDAEHPLQQLEGVAGMLTKLQQLSQTLRQWRDQYALPGEERPDYRLRLNEKRKIESIEIIRPNAAHQIVEECMILANRCAADFLKSRNFPALFITHSGVRAERQEALMNLIKENWPELAESDISTPEGYAHIVRTAHQTPAHPLKSLILRQLDRSLFAPDAAPHFGMGLPAYTTFTSPLRKANDFYVHRLIKRLLNGETIACEQSETIATLQAQLIKARQAVNEMEQWLKCQYMESLPAQVWPATIIRTNSSGFQVRLDANGIEGFVSTRDMPEKFSFDQSWLRLSSKTCTFSLDDKIEVEVNGVDWKRRQINFKLKVEAAIEETAV